MPTLNLGTDDIASNGTAIPYWKQGPNAPTHSLPPPALAALALKEAGEAVFAPQPAFVPPTTSTTAAAVSSSDETAEIAKTTTEISNVIAEDPIGGEKKVTVAVSIGTDSSPLFKPDGTINIEDDTNTDGGGDWDESKGRRDDELLRDTPDLNLATVASHMMKLQALLKNDGKPIAIDAFETIAQVSDMLDQVYYWGIVESRFPDAPFSALCECEVIETLTPVLLNDRPALVTSALKALTTVLQQPIACDMFARSKGSFPALFTALTRFPSKEELIADAIAVCRSAAPGNVEEFLGSDCLSGVLSGMQRHTRNMEIQKRGVMLFADVVGMPRKDPETVPISIIFVHVGQVVDFVFMAAQQQKTSSQISDAVAHFFEVASSRPENLKKLLAHPAFIPTIEGIATKGTTIRNPRAIIASLSTLSNTIPYLSLRGKMNMADTVRDVMIKAADETVLVTCFAMQHALLLSAKQTPPPLPVPKRDGKEGEDDEEEDDDGAPKLTRPKPTASDVANAATTNPMAAYEALKHHMTEEQIPQCILIALDHFGEEGDRLHQVGRAAVAEMAMRRFHWQ